MIEDVELELQHVAGGADARKAAQDLNVLWRDESIQDPGVRAKIIACATNVSSSQLDPETMAIHARTCSQACGWCIGNVDSSIRSNYFHGPLCKGILTFSKILFQSGVIFLRTHHMEALNTLMDDFFRFLRATCVVQNDDKEMDKAYCDTTREAVKLASEFSFETSKTSTEATELIVTVIRGLIGVGSVAAAGGLLNMAWRATMGLIGMETLRDVTRHAVVIPDTVVTLLGLAFRSLKEGLRVVLSENQGFQESKEKPHPLTICKYFLVQATSISRLYGHEATAAQAQMVAFCRYVSAVLLGLDLGQSAPAAAANVVSETVAPVALALLLSSSKTPAGSGLVKRVVSDDGNECFDDVNHVVTLPERWRLTGSVYVFLSLFEASKELSAEIVVDLGGALEWLLGVVSGMPVYGMMFELKPAATSITKKDPAALFYLTVQRALETFAGAAASNKRAWEELEGFLFRNVVHPVPVCRELVLDLWCFVMRSASESLCRKHLEALLQIFQSCFSNPGVVEILARAICRLAKVVPLEVLSVVAPMIFSEDTFGSKGSATLATAVLEMGFPVDRVAAAQSMGVHEKPPGDLMEECRAFLNAGARDQVSVGMGKISAGVSMLKEVQNWKDEERKNVASRMPNVVSELLALQDSCLGSHSG